MSFPSSPEQGAAAAGEQDRVEPGGRLAALGLRLRQAREARGLSANVLADRLRLGVEQLEALETGDRERLPEPVFVIAQVRRVAVALGLEISADLQALRSSGELQPRPRPGALVFPRPLRPTPVAPSPAPVAAQEPESPADDLMAAQVPRARAAGWGRLVVGALLLLLALLWAGGRLRGSVSAPGDRPRPQAAAWPRPLGAASSDASSGTAAVAAGMVVLASREPSWVEVRRSDGVILFRGLLRGSRLFSLEPGLEVMAARPDLVTSRIGSAPAQPLGPISEVRWRSLPAAR